MCKDLIEKINERDLILYDDPIFSDINKVLEKTLKLTSKLNLGYKKPEEIREILKEITGREVSSSVQVLTPFNTDFGANIKIGEGVFINKGCMIVDLGGVEIEDNVLIGPRVNLLSVNHPTDIKSRRGVILKKVRIKKNAWIGASVTVCPGVTIGENSIIGAGSVVTKDVKDNSVYAGVPAKFIKNI